MNMPPVPMTYPNGQADRLANETDAAYYARLKRPAPLTGETYDQYVTRLAGLTSTYTTDGHGYRF